MTVYLRLQLQRQHNFVEILKKPKTNSTTVYHLILRFRKCIILNFGEKQLLKS